MASRTVVLKLPAPDFEFENWKAGKTNLEIWFGGPMGIQFRFRPKCEICNMCPEDTDPELWSEVFGDEFENILQG